MSRVTLPTHWSSVSDGEESDVQMKRRKIAVPRQTQVIPTRPTYYTWNWVKSADKTVLIQGHGRFTNKRSCQLAAKAVTPAISEPAILRIGCFTPDETRLRTLEYNFNPWEQTEAE